MISKLSNFDHVSLVRGREAVLIDASKLKRDASVASEKGI